MSVRQKSTGAVPHRHASDWPCLETWLWHERIARSRQSPAGRTRSFPHRSRSSNPAAATLTEITARPWLKNGYLGKVINPGNVLSLAARRAPALRFCPASSATHNDANATGRTSRAHAAAWNRAAAFGHVLRNGPPPTSARPSGRGPFSESSQPAETLGNLGKRVLCLNQHSENA